MTKQPKQDQTKRRLPMTKQVWIIFVLAALLLLSLFWNLNQHIRIQELENAGFPVLPPFSTDINSFEACAAAGYPIMESYPARCATPDGRTFVQEVGPIEYELLPR